MDIHDIILSKLTPKTLLCYQDNGRMGWEYKCFYFRTYDSQEINEVNELKGNFLHNHIKNLAQKLIERALKKDNDLADRLFYSGNTINMEVITHDFDLFEEIKPVEEKELIKFKGLVYQIGNSMHYVNKFLLRKKELKAREPTSF